MKRKPWAIVVLATLHILAPIGNILLNALISNEGVLKYFSKAFSLEYFRLNWFIFVCPVIAGIAIYLCKKWTFYIYIVAITVLFFYSYEGYASKSETIGILPVILVYLVNIIVVTYFFIPNVRKVYFDPRLRWWESKPRYVCDFQCQVYFTEKTIAGHITNISENGLFFKSESLPDDGLEIKVEIPFNDDVLLSFTGQSIQHGEMAMSGCGMEFSHTKESRSQAKALVADLDRQGQRMRGREAAPEDSFSFWVRRLFSSGRGFVPKNHK